MQKFGKTLITDSGRKMLVQVDGAEGQLTYTRAALFSQDIKSMAEEDQIALVDLNGKQVETTVEVTQVTDTTVTVSASFNNSSIKNDLPFNSIGWFAKTSVDNTEHLMAVTPSLSEQVLVAGVEGASTSSLDIDMVFGRSHNTNVVLSPNQAGVVNKAQMEEAINKVKLELEAEFPKNVDKTIKDLKDQVAGDLTNAQKTLRDEIKTLYPLNSPDGNNIYDTTINLDTYSTVGTTKFLGCKLQSTGQMTDFDQTIDGLYGWIFNVPKWNGATEYQQIVYICNYGDGTLIYLRSHVDNTGKTVEDFEKLTTDKDLTAFAKDINDQIKNAGQVKTVDGIAPDAAGNVETDHYTKDEIDKKVTDINSRVEAEEHREWTHHADTYDAGLDYSKAHPDVLVSTP